MRPRHGNHIVVIPGMPGFTSDICLFVPQNEPPWFRQERNARRRMRNNDEKRSRKIRRRIHY